MLNHILSHNLHVFLFDMCDNIRYIFFNHSCLVFHPKPYLQFIMVSIFLFCFLTLCLYGDRIRSQICFCTKKNIQSCNQIDKILNTFWFLIFYITIFIFVVIWIFFFFSFLSKNPLVFFFGRDRIRSLRIFTLIIWA